MLNSKTKPFIKLIKTPLGFYFYDANKNEIINISKDLYEFLHSVLYGGHAEANNETLGHIEYLQGCGFLLGPQIENIQHPLTNHLPIFTERKIDELVLQVTQGCNLRCAYCVYSENNTTGQRVHSSKDMDFKLAKRAIDYYFTNSIDSEIKTIAFYGGEPLLNFSLIKRVVEYINNTYFGCDVHFTLTTNATLLSKDIIQFFISNEFDLTISLDGPKNIHDIHRRYANGVGSFADVERNIDLIWKTDAMYAKKVLLNMVVDPKNDYCTISKLFTNKNVVNMNINTSVVNSNGVVNPTTHNNKYYEGLQYFLFREYLNKKRGQEIIDEHSYIARNYLDALEDRIKKFLQPKDLQPISAPSGPCVPGRKRLFVNTYGIFFPCERVIEAEGITSIGDIDSGIIQDKVKSILNVSSNFENKCKRCWALSLCGLCIKGVVSSSGISKDKVRTECNQSKTTALSLLRHKILEYEVGEKL